jgi:hypothetical protein
VPKLPAKLIVFTLVFAIFWIYLAPKRAELATRIIRGKQAARLEDSVRILVEGKIRREICRFEDLCDYRPKSWERIARIDANGAEAFHDFYMDGNLRKYLFRVRNGAVSEVIDLR